MNKKYGRNFSRKEALRRRIVKRIMSWNSIMQSTSDKRIKDLCAGFKNYWERELRKLR